jgi:tetratricopeptide (TPR) repeat protein
LLAPAGHQVFTDIVFSTNSCLALPAAQGFQGNLRLELLAEYVHRLAIRTLLNRTTHGFNLGYVCVQFSGEGHTLQKEALFKDGQAMPGLQEAQLRHAKHYETVLTTVDKFYEQGGEAFNQALDLFDLEWPNFQIAHAWAEMHFMVDETAARLCSTFNYYGYYMLDLRQPRQERIHWIEAGLSAARHLKDRDAETIQLTYLGEIYETLGETRRANEYYTQALAIARETGDRECEASALSGMSWAYYNSGDNYRALELCNRALEIDRELGERRGESRDLGTLGLILIALGQPQRAIEILEQTLKLGRELGDPQDMGATLGSLGEAYLAWGDAQRAIEYFEQALAIQREIGDRYNEAAHLIGLAACRRENSSAECSPTQAYF